MNKAWKLIEDPRNWRPFVLACDSQGNSVDIYSSIATGFSAVGAIARVYGRPKIPSTAQEAAALTKCKTSLQSNGQKVRAFWEWEIENGRTHSQVLKVLKDSDL